MNITLLKAKIHRAVVKQADLDILGANFREITDQQKEQFKINYGLEVIKVSKGAFAEQGISKGYIIMKVNDEPIKTIDDMQKCVKEASTAKDPVLFIQAKTPTGATKYFAVPLEK